MRSWTTHRSEEFRHARRDWNALGGRMVVDAPDEDLAEGLRLTNDIIDMVCGSAQSGTESHRSTVRRLARLAALTECYGEAQRRKYQRKDDLHNLRRFGVYQCSECGNEYVPGNPRSKTCSARCKSRRSTRMAKEKLLEKRARKE